jgi:hypothetical protein
MTRAFYFVKVLVMSESFITQLRSLDRQTLTDKLVELEETRRLVIAIIKAKPLRRRAEGSSKRAQKRNAVANA